MTFQCIVVVGASAGGVESLMALARGLPADFGAPVLVVLHVSPAAPNLLPQILRGSGPLPAAEAMGGEPLEPGRIYVAAPDRHLLVEGGRVAVTRGPKENGFRPSVDALFRSAAYEYGPAVVGVVLSGTMDDGTSGLWTVRRRGGVTVVQDPRDALYGGMPGHALEHVRVDHIVPAAELGPLLARLVKGEPRAAEGGMDEQELRRLELEVRVAAEEGAFEKGVLNLGELSPIACPDCHGAMVAIREGDVVRYRCHTGHAFSVGTLLSDVTASVEDNLWKALRALEESIMLLRQMGEHYAHTGRGPLAEACIDRAHDMENHSRAVRDLVLVQERLSGDLLRGVGDAGQPGGEAPYRTPGEAG